MSFASYTYAAFLSAVLLVHRAAPLGARPWVLIAASYGFYATWSPRYLPLLVGVSLFNWAYARRVLVGRVNAGGLWPGVAVNVGLLVYYKYADFFVQTLYAVACVDGRSMTLATTGVAVPLGISFFTFQGVAYLVDVAAGGMPIRPLRDFLLFKGFWPQLVAGPILRAEDLAAQLVAPPPVTYRDLSAGVRRLILGAFKKLVLADLLAQQVDLAFMEGSRPHALDSLAGVVGFGFQIYFDFSAYSDFAIGSARLFGYVLPENFLWPYGARSPREFWARWHVTLSSWLRDYAFLPLSFAWRARPALRHLGLVATMTLCGLWHGAAATFVAWGAWHGVALVTQQTVLRALFDGRTNTHMVLSRLLTGLIVFAGWLLFRAPSLDAAAEHAYAIATWQGGSRPALMRENGLLTVGLVCGGAQAMSWLEHAFGAQLRAWGTRPPVAWCKPAAYALLLALVVVMAQEARPFVYFQF